LRNLTQDFAIVSQITPVPLRKMAKDSSRWRNLAKFDQRCKPMYLKNTFSKNTNAICLQYIILNSKMDFTNENFETIIDKGTLDALMSDNSQQVSSIITERSFSVQLIFEHNQKLKGER
jgi:hypothetical protein